METKPEGPIKRRPARAQGYFVEATLQQQQSVISMWACDRAACFPGRRATREDEGGKEMSYREARREYPPSDSASNRLSTRAAGRRRALSLEASGFHSPNNGKSPRLHNGLHVQEPKDTAHLSHIQSAT